MTNSFLCKWAPAPGLLSWCFICAVMLGTGGRISDSSIVSKTKMEWSTWNALWPILFFCCVKRAEVWNFTPQSSRDALWTYAMVRVYMCVVLGFFFLGIALRAHALHRTRWVMYVMKMRLIAMKTRIRKLLNFFHHGFYKLVDVKFWVCWKSWCLENFENDGSVFWSSKVEPISQAAVEAELAKVKKEHCTSQLSGNMVWF